MKSSDDDKSSAAPAATEPTSTEVPSGESAVSSPPIPSGVERKKETSETSVDELDDYMASALAEMEISLLTVKDDRDLTDTQFHKLLKCLLQKTNQGNWNQGN